MFGPVFGHVSKILQHAKFVNYQLSSTFAKLQISRTASFDASRQKRLLHLSALRSYATDVGSESQVGATNSNILNSQIEDASTTKNVVSDATSKVSAANPARRRPMSPFALYYRSVVNDLKKEMGGKASEWMKAAKRKFDALPFEEKMKFYDEFQLNLESNRLVRANTREAKPQPRTTEEKLKRAERLLKRYINGRKRLQSKLGFKERLWRRRVSAFALFVSDQLSGQQERASKMMSVVGAAFRNLDEAQKREYRERGIKMFEENKPIRDRYDQWVADLHRELEDDKLRSVSQSTISEEETQKHRVRINRIRYFLTLEERVPRFQRRVRFLRAKLKAEAKKAKAGEISAPDQKKVEKRAARKTEKAEVDTELDEDFDESEIDSALEPKKVAKQVKAASITSKSSKKSGAGGKKPRKGKEIEAKHKQ